MHNNSLEQVSGLGWAGHHAAVQLHALGKGLVVWHKHCDLLVGWAEAGIEASIHERLAEGPQCERAELTQLLEVEEHGVWQQQRGAAGGQATAAAAGSCEEEEEAWTWR